MPFGAKYPKDAGTRFIPIPFAAPCTRPFVPEDRGNVKPPNFTSFVKNHALMGNGIEN
jgi:hypothetical protein